MKSRKKCLACAIFACVLTLTCGTRALFFSIGFHNLRTSAYDGANMWVTDVGDNTLKKLDSSGNILLTVNVCDSPLYPAFDGTNIWVPNSGSDSVSVVRATGGLSGATLATLTFNGLTGPRQVAFDGERILVTNSAR